MPAACQSKCETRSELHCPIWGKWGHKKSKKLPHKNRLSSEYYLVVAIVFRCIVETKLDDLEMVWGEIEFFLCAHERNKQHYCMDLGNGNIESRKIEF